MATLGIEEVTESAIRAVARDCGSLSIECSDVAAADSCNKRAGIIVRRFGNVAMRRHLTLA